MSKCYKNMELEKLIKNGLKYIGLRDNLDITIDLILKIREYLELKDIKWYEKTFPDACKFDQAIGEKIPYSDDGIKYYFENEVLKYCILYNSDQVFYPYQNFSLNLSGYKKCADIYKYRYINEIDHFFTHAINNFLLKKSCSFYRESGLKMIENDIIKNSKLD